MKLDVVIVGVGGQGTLLASKIMGRLALSEGYDVKVSEVHGMAQRGGNVITHVRFGEKVYAPLVTEGEADVIVAFEALEALRALPFLRKGGRIVVNTQHIQPMPVIMGVAKYPENALDTLRAAGDVTALDALAMAQACGSARAVNIVLLGALAAKLPIERQHWLDALAACVPPKTLQTNTAAFTAGWDAGTEMK